MSEENTEPSFEKSFKENILALNSTITTLSEVLRKTHDSLMLSNAAGQEAVDYLMGLAQNEEVPMNLRKECADRAGHLIKIFKVSVS